MGRYKKVVKGIFVTRDRPFLLPVKCEIAIFFLVNRDFHSRREPWFSKTISFIFREAWNANVVFFVNCERAALFSMKRDLYLPPFTTLMSMFVILLQVEEL